MPNSRIINQKRSLFLRENMLGETVNVVNEENFRVISGILVHIGISSTIGTATKPGFYVAGKHLEVYTITCINATDDFCMIHIRPHEEYDKRRNYKLDRAAQNEIQNI